MTALVGAATARQGPFPSSGLPVLLLLVPAKVQDQDLALPTNLTKSSDEMVSSRLQLFPGVAFLYDYS